MSDKSSNNLDPKNILTNIEVDRAKVLSYISKNYVKIILITLVVLSLFFYFVYYRNRVGRYLLKAEKSYNKIFDAYGFNSNKKYMKGNYKVCDFYIATSYKSYLPCTNYYDYASPEAIKSALDYGARCIDLDVMNKGFGSCTVPVICNGEEVGNWHYTTYFTFEEGIETIRKHAFSKNLRNNKDPLFININFKTWYNKDTINRCAEIIKKHLGNKFIDQKYMYQGRYSNINLGTSPIKDILNKIVIMSTSNVKNTDMDELVNLDTNIGGNFRILNHSQVKETYDAKELTEFNKKNITFVVPDFSDRNKKNYNFFTPYYLGCQFIAMNYSQPDEWMKQYIEQFKECSLILKPYKLRFHPVFIEPPLKQTPKVSFAPRKASSPFYSITY